MSKELIEALEAAERQLVSMYRAACPQGNYEAGNRFADADEAVIGARAALSTHKARTEGDVERVARAIYEKQRGLFGDATDKEWQDLREEARVQGHDIARAAIAALSATQDEGWRDMASAPKDGTAFWAFEKHANFPPSYYEARFVCVTPHMGAPTLRCHNRSANRWSEPTHWRPLPAAPSGEAE